MMQFSDQNLILAKSMKFRVLEKLFLLDSKSSFDILQQVSTTQETLLSLQIKNNVKFLFTLENKCNYMVLNNS